MTISELLDANKCLILKETGIIHDSNDRALTRLKVETYTHMITNLVGKVTKLGDAIVDVARHPSNDKWLLLKRRVELKDLIAEHGSIDIDADTGEIKTLTEISIGTVPDDILADIRNSNAGKIDFAGEALYVVKDGTHITLKKSHDELKTFQDVIAFGIANNVSNVTLTTQSSRYRVNGRSIQFNKLYLEKDLKAMLEHHDTGITKTIEHTVYTTTKVVDGISVNIHALYDKSYILIFDFIKNKERKVTDLFNEEWLSWIKSRNKSEHGGIVLLSEKQDLPEIVPMFLNNITTQDDNVITYGKSIPEITAQHLPFSTDIKLSSVTNINSDVVLMDFMTAVEYWDSIYEMVDNGSVVVLTVNESSIYMTLNMVIETFEKNYQFRKFIDTLLGINVVSLQYQTDTTDFIVKQDYIYNNKQFQILLGSKTYNKLDLEDKKYKHYFLSLGGEHKSIETVLREILEHANKIGAHDISLSAGAPPAFRKGRDMICDFIDDKLLPYMTESMFLEIVNDQTKQERFRQNPGAGLPHAYSVPGIGRYRVNVYSQRGSIAMSLRKIPETIFSMDWCGLGPEIQERIRGAKTGLILVTGPTGSGKSTTLAAIIDYFNEHRKAKIIATEDPIEYLHRRKNSIVEQIEIGQDSDSFLHTLESNMRNNPDILLIGEIRDAATLGVAINSSVTGHLVLATLHTKGAIETIQRMLDMVSTDDRENIKSLISQNLILTITQQLLPKVGGGMVGTHECMVLNDAIRSAISSGDGKSLQSIGNYLSADRQSGMCNMDFAIAKHVHNGLVSLKDAETYAVNMNSVTRYVKSLAEGKS